ncbi:hypothetical protein H0H92_001285, partial [Tricholoma furcatifolium]
MQRRHKSIRRPSYEIPDERSRLIPAAQSEIIAGDLDVSNVCTALERAVYKERLGNIVRSKEGIMVNVSSPLPFNLHNQPRAVIDMMVQGSYMSSSSRSASTSTFHESQSPSNHPSARHASRRVSSGLRITSLPSTHTISRSVSPSSLASARRDEDGRTEKVDIPPSILGVRLVHRFNPTYGYHQPRGRVKSKKSEGATIEAAHEFDPEVDSSPDGDHASLRSAHDDAHPQVSISPASDKFEFQIQEVGALT